MQISTSSAERCWTSYAPSRAANKAMRRAICSICCSTWGAIEVDAPGHNPSAPSRPVAVQALRLSGRYEVANLNTDLIGQGGMGTVYRGVDRETSQPIVIKVLRSDRISQRPDALLRLQREGEALRQLNHPNIVKLLALVAEADQYYLVMEYVPGGSLRDLLETISPGEFLPIQRVVQIGLELSDALARAHHLQIIHRDLRPIHRINDPETVTNLPGRGHKN